jgi:hypothetical protein
MDLLLIAVLLSGLAGLAGALTGAGAPKPLRRVGVPVISTLFALAILFRWQLIFLMARSGVLSQGYGIPDPTDPKPSKLGAFWYKIFKGNDRKTSIAVRATLGIQECFVLALIPLVTGNWFWYLLGCSGIIGTWVYFGAIKNNEGMFKLFGRDLLFEEVLIHGINTLIYCLLAILCRG